MSLFLQGAGIRSAPCKKAGSQQIWATWVRISRPNEARKEGRKNWSKEGLAFGFQSMRAPGNKSSNQFNCFGWVDPLNAMGQPRLGLPGDILKELNFPEIAFGGPYPPWRSSKFIDMYSLVLWRAWFSCLIELRACGRFTYLVALVPDWVPNLSPDLVPDQFTEPISANTYHHGLSVSL